ncbi:MAG TPA: DUF3467 domain-containing protein [Chloroflexi bacterium]|nr:DUF3467 domain-containing protein [Chloroflexota bacterium]
MSDHPAPPPKKPQPPRLEFDNNTEPVYANMARITHSPSEFVIDLARLLPGDSGAKVQTRVVMSPLSAKLFYRALTENLAKYEANFGEIKMPGSPSLADQLFRPHPPTE